MNKTPKYPSSGFEKWLDDYFPDVTYTAESDGFVAAFGQEPNEKKMPHGVTGTGVIRAGEGPEDCLPIMTRFGPGYQGAMLAVPKGYSWRVDKNKNTGEVVVRWLPVKPSSTTSPDLSPR